MSSSKRECASCQFFQNAQLAGNGWCLHPKRQLASDVRILVRARELACRNSWGQDLWVDKSSPATTLPETPSGYQPVPLAARHADDQVTSVVDTTSRGGANGAGDDQVTHTAVRAESPVPRRAPNDFNAPANDDQDDRVRIMARGSHDAILRARERAAQRRKPTRPTVLAEAGPSTPVNGAEPDPAPASTPPARDDAAPPATSRGGHQAVPPVPREELSARRHQVSPAVGPDDRFDSVPRVQPDVELPRLRQFLRQDPGHQDGAATALPEDVRLSSYELVLRRAQEIKAASPQASPAGRHRSRSGRQAAPAPEYDDAGVAPAPSPDTEIVSSAGLPEPASPAAAEVVWDLPPDRLNLAFSRIREALDEYEPSARPQARRHAPAPPVEEPAPHDIAWEDEETRVAGAPLPAVNAWDDDPHEDVIAPDPPEPGVPARTRDVRAESPKSSWWRSLNFGIRRRVAPEPSAPAQGDATWHEDSAVMWDDDPGDDVQEWSGMEQAAGDVNIPAVEDREDDWVAAGHADPSPMSAPFASLATTEESWLEDEIGFPEPQPASWHDARAALLAEAREPDPLDEVVLPPLPDGPEPEPRVEATNERSRELAVPATIERPEMPSYELGNPNGLAAFRAALFGNTPGIPHQGPVRNDTYGDPDLVDRHAGRVARALDLPYGDTRKRWPAPSRTAPSRNVNAEPAFDIRDAFIDQDEVERTFAVASGIRKCCRTCRSFQPSGDRERGRCGNEWAGTYRQVVDADQLPCRSSIGDWWLAADLAWIPPDDVIRPSTPHTDRLEARANAERETLHAGGRRVRTRKAV